MNYDSLAKRCDFFSAFPPPSLSWDNPTFQRQRSVIPPRSVLIRASEVIHPLLPAPRGGVIYDFVKWLRDDPKKAGVFARIEAFLQFRLAKTKRQGSPYWKLLEDFILSKNVAT
ncbi:hypothetical protein AVEN_133593-1 [Araneus ventricosus]|uniref:Uncharacterized protein n=1 Tax=Araneus ventricosus TaxID=182803 RepID=A0A4Y2JHP5_ARAVE|nr:hypothetical protein AVEN_133593-1 [Araneus ventricosus]